LRLACEALPLWQATEETLEQIGLPPPYWAFCWPGSMAIARWLLDHPDFVRGRRVLDLASGCGIAAIAAARVGGLVTANDIDRFACLAIGMNAIANGVHVDIEQVDLLGTPATDRWDVVLAGDVCYERPFAERVRAWLEAQAERGAMVLIADPGRAYFSADGLELMATFRVPTSLDLEDREERECRMFRISG